jgi:predicted enzyme related to lactoylglutathione lyase
VDIDLTGTQVWVHDQDVALEFYTEKLGMELRSDATLPEMGFRWLTVAVPGNEVEIVLMAIPGPPMLDADTADEIGRLLAKGFAQTMFLTTEDCNAAYEQLRERGVEFSEPPTPRPYGIDASFRDPSGNSFRLTQPTP